MSTNSLLFCLFRGVLLPPWMWLILWLDSPEECSGSDILGLVKPDHKKAWGFCLGLLQFSLPKCSLGISPSELGHHVVRKHEQFLGAVHTLNSQGLCMTVCSRHQFTLHVGSCPGRGSSSLKQITVAPTTWNRSKVQLMGCWEEEMIVVVLSSNSGIFCNVVIDS